MSEIIEVLDSINHHYDNTTSGLTASTTKTALDELVAISSTTTYIDVTQPPYNADNTGATPCGSIVQQAVNDLQTADVGGTIFFPKGRYNFEDQAVTVSRPGITFRGVSSWSRDSNTELMQASQVFTESRTTGDIFTVARGAASADSQGATFIDLEIRGPFAANTVKCVHIDGANGFAFKHAFRGCQITHGEYGIYMDGTTNSTGGLNIQQCAIVLCDLWGVYAVSSLNHCYIVGNVIRQNGANAAGSGFEDRSVGGGINIAAPNAVTISGNDLEGQSCGVAMGAGRAVIVMGNYFEANAQCAVFLNAVKAYNVSVNYSNGSNRDNVFYLKRCTGGTFEDNENSGKAVIDEGKDVKATVSQLDYAWSSGYSEPNRGDTTVPADFPLDEPLEPYKGTMTGPTPVNATYELSTDIRGPQGQVDNVYKLTAVGGSGYVNVGLSGSQALVAGDVVIQSAWVFIPEGNTSGFYREIRENIDAGGWESNTRTLTEFPKGQWVFWKHVHKATASESLETNIRLNELTDGESRYFYGVHAQVYQRDTNNPKVIADAGGSGDVVGPGSAVDSSLVAFDGTTGKLIKDAGYVIPAGGDSGKVLKKQSAADYDYAWGNDIAGVAEAPTNDYSYFRNGALDGGLAAWSQLLKAYGEKRLDIGAMSGAEQLNVSLHNAFMGTVGASITLTAVTDKENCSASLKIEVTADAAHDLSAFDWGTAGAPPMTSGKRYRIAIFTDDTGTTWDGIWNEY